MKKTGAELTIEILERFGIKTIAGIPGGYNLPLYDALRKSSITHILARHEQGAGFIAQGMARSSGKPAVCFATSGPGATNLLTALADAMMDSVPIIAITGQVPTSSLGTNAFQEVDICKMAAPVTRFCKQITRPEELYPIMHEAFRVASGPRPGPVLIDIPKDIQTALIEYDFQSLDTGRAPNIKAPSTDEINRMVDMINQAKRPFLYIGGGIIHSGASKRLKEFAEKTQIPIASTLMGLGAVRADHPLFMGMLGMHGAEFLNQALSKTDLLLAFGVRFDDRAIGKSSHFCPNAKIVHVDIDENEINKIRKADIGLKADVGIVLEKLTEQCSGGENAGWHKEIRRLKKNYYDHMDPANDSDHPLALIATVGSLAQEDAIITTDVGQHQMWAAQAYPFRGPRTFLSSGGLGTMGFGLPAAIGAALENPQKCVICFTGDGSFLMNIQELATLAELQLNVKIVLLNNEHLGLVKQQQELFYNKEYIATSFKAKPDFAAIAEKFGIKGTQISEQKEPLAALAEALINPGPCLIEIAIDPDELVLPMVPPGGANHMMVSKRPQLV